MFQNKWLKKITAVLCILLLLIMPQVMAEPEPTESTVPTEIPEALEPTKAPATNTPAATEAPSATEAPASTEAPSATEAPASTEAPTEAPAATETLAPVATPKPTAKPTGTAKPTMTATPTVTSTPSITTTPTGTPYATIVPPDKEQNYKVNATKVNATVSSTNVLKIDGQRDTIWDYTSSNPIQNVAWGTSGASGEFSIVWDQSNLYILVTVHDKTNDVSSDLFSRKDCVEIFLNENNTYPTEYGQGDQHYLIARNGELKFGSGASSDLIKCAVSETEDGYQVEAAIAWTSMIPLNGTYIGLDVRINDSQGKGNRDYMIQWSDTSMTTHKDLSKIGTFLLK